VRQPGGRFKFITIKSQLLGLYRKPSPQSLFVEVDTIGKGCFEANEIIQRN
jgi:hypothetical protein